MSNRRTGLILLAVIISLLLIAFLIWFVLIRPDSTVETDPFEETFDEAGTWMVGEGAVAQGQVRDGVYEMYVELVGDVFWATGDRRFGDGIYEVEASPLEGAIDNGYGMLLRVDQEDNRFYVFKISSDGYVFVGYCEDSCEEVEPFIEMDWFPSPAVNQGLGVTNQLRVAASGSEMIFSVNDTEVGRVDDEKLLNGDIGLMAETFAPGGLRVAFDNFKVTPLE